MLGTAIRYARAAEQIVRAGRGPLAAPMKLTFALTYRCQYRCRTCNIWMRSPHGELTTDEVLAFVDANRATAWLDVTGGEIFLRDDVDAILDAIVGTWTRLVVLHFPTNGFLTSRIAAAVARIAPRAPAQFIVTVSVDGEETLNDTVRGIKGGFRRQLATFRALRSIAGVRPVLGMTLSSWNAGAFAATFAACRRECPDLDIADFHVNVAQRSEHYYGNGDVPGVTAPADGVAADLAAYMAARHRAVSPSAWLESTYLANLTKYIATGRTPMPCHALRSSCFIDPHGIVYPCLSYSRPIGSLRESGMSLARIWEAQTTRALQAEIAGGECPQCWTACDAYPAILGNLCSRS